MLSIKLLETNNVKYEWNLKLNKISQISRTLDLKYFVREARMIGSQLVKTFRKTCLKMHKIFFINIEVFFRS